MKMFKENLENVRILLGYGSNYGSTEDIAKKIGEMLVEKNINLYLLNVHDLTKKDTIDFNQYQCVLIGSGVYAGGYSPKMKRFLKRNKDALRETSLVAFAVCGEVHNPSRKEVAQQKYVDKFLAKYDLKPDYGAVFAGVLDLSTNSPYSKMELKIVRMINKKDPMVQLDQRNDYRNWDDVRDFVDKFSQVLPYIIESKRMLQNQDNIPNIAAR